MYRVYFSLAYTQFNVYFFFHVHIHKIRSLAPSQRGKRPLLLDISNTTELTQSENFAQQPKRRTFKNIKDVQIQERKAVLLSDNGIRATQEVISEHVNALINSFFHISIICT